jgi:hypothetical protein
MPALIMVWVRIPTLIIAVIALVVWYLIARKNKQFLFTLPVTLWLVSLIAYQVIRLFVPSKAGDALSYWGAAMMLHAAIVLAGVGWVMLKDKYYD